MLSYLIFTRWGFNIIILPGVFWIVIREIRGLNNSRHSSLIDKWCNIISGKERWYNNFIVSYHRANHWNFQNYNFPNSLLFPISQIIKNCTKQMLIVMFEFQKYLKIKHLSLLPMRYTCIEPRVNIDGFRFVYWVYILR